MVRYLLVLLLAACGPIPVQVSKTSQEQTQRQSNEQSAEQQSSHASESKQGTNCVSFSARTMGETPSPKPSSPTQHQPIH